MATNPVSAFLAGFAAVDQLETNRQNRALQKENQSRIRTLWKREDKDYERQQLELYRHDSLVAFDAITKQIVEDVKIESENIRAAEGDDAADAYTNEWYGNADVVNGKVAGRGRVFNEAMKRMIARDSDFGEHVALSLKLDPYDKGLLLKDRSKPVSGVVLIPGELNPDGSGQPAASIEVDSVNGNQPMTDNRTASPNDPVSIRGFGMPELVRVFGQGVMSNSVLVTKFLRNAVGGDKPTGRLASQDKQVAQNVIEGESTEVIDDGHDASLDTEAQGAAYTDPREQQALQKWADDLDISMEEMLYRTQGKPLGPLVDTILGEEGGGKEPNTPPPLLEVADPNQAALDFFGPDAGQKFIDIVVKAETQPSALEISSEVAATGREALARSQDTSFMPKAEPGTIPAPSIDLEGLDTDRLSAAIQEGFALTKEGSVFPAEKANDVPASRRGELAPSRVATAKGAKTATDNAGVPGSSQALNETAAAVLRPVSGRPSFYKLYNAVSLAKLGLIDQKQLMRYARTGAFDAAAKRTIKMVTSGDFTHFYDMTRAEAGAGPPQPIGSFRTGTAGLKDTRLKDRKEQLNHLKTDPAFMDWMGDPDEGRIHQLLDAMGRSNDALAQAAVETNGFVQPYDMNDPSILARLAPAARWQNNFENVNVGQTITNVLNVGNPLRAALILNYFGSNFTNQQLDDKFLFTFINGLFQADINKRDLTLGMTAQDAGIASQKGFNAYASTYGILYGMHARNENIPFNQRVVDIKGIENETNRILGLPEEVKAEKYKGLDKESLREEIAEEFIKKQLGL